MHKAWLEKRTEFKSKYAAHARPHSTSIKNLYKNKYFIGKNATENTPEIVFASTTHKPLIYANNLQLIDDVLTSPTTEHIKSTTPYAQVSLIKRKTTKAPTTVTNGAGVSSLNVSKSLVTSRHTHWSGWNKWSMCSRSCGGGITTQIRRCLLTLNSQVENNTITTLTSNCIGVHKRFRICNEQSCPDTDADFREQQCTKFNNETFSGNKYKWEAYIKDDAECELNCKPVGMRYFATLKEKVIDGTICARPSLYFKRNVERAVCVDGTCKAIHSGGVISGTLMNNGAVRCGDLICRPVSSLFNTSPLKPGYHQIATIPAGASNISITELKSSTNRLVLKSMTDKYVLNGDYSVSLSGIYEVGGAIFDYRRIDGMTDETHLDHVHDKVTEWITSLGPLTEPVELLVFQAQETEVNHGIRYEYLLPLNAGQSSEELSYDNVSAETEPPQITAIPSDTYQRPRQTLKSSDAAAIQVSPTITPPISTGRNIHRRKRRFQWKIVAFTTCSKSCGGGTQSPIIRCVRENPLRVFVMRKCAQLEKPVINESILRCNTQACPGFWKVSTWTECSCLRPTEAEYQTREIKCVQEIGIGTIMQVPNGACTESPPISVQTCGCTLTNKNKMHSIKHRMYTHSNSIVDSNNINQSTQLVVSNHKKSGIWLASSWNEFCSTTCGDGVQYRSLFCDRSFPNYDRCDLNQTPDITRHCFSEKSCNVGAWFVGPWSICTGDCFNLTQSRHVYCIRKTLIVDNAECLLMEKPATNQNCSIKDVADCDPRWHYSEWTACSKNCDGGTQMRSIKCIMPKENEMKESEECTISERLPTVQNCNAHPCEVTTEQYPNDLTRVDPIQNDTVPECIDEIPNCHLALLEHLCNYTYFKKNCCHTCRYPSFTNE